MEILKVILVLFLVNLLSILRVNGLNCYSCTMSADEADRACLNDPAKVTTSPPTVKCSKKFCYIERIEYQDPKGVVYSFIRGCSDNTDSGDGEVIDENLITYYRSCTSNLCNIGDGKEPIGDDMSNQAAGKIHGTIYAPGVGGSITNIELPGIWTLALSLLSAIFLLRP